MSVVNRKQFIIMRKPYEDDEFITLELDNGYILSYHKELKVQVSEKNILLGYAFSSEKECEIRLDNGAIENTYGWAGRWVLITDNKVYMDAIGSLGVFYTTDNENGYICSSSLGLISNVAKDAEWNSDYILKRGNYRPLDYYPGPTTPRKNVKSLFSTQFIDLTEEKIGQRDDFDFSRYRNLSKEELIAKIVELESNVLKNIQNEFKEEIWLPLTAGVDSRTILAIAEYAGVKVNTYTLHRYDTELDDLKTPRILARMLGLNHLEYKDKYVLNENIKKKKEDILKHCGGRITVGTEIAQYLSGVDVPIKDKAIVLWGPVWEIGIHYYEHFFKNLDLLKDEQDIINAFNEITGGAIEKSNVHRESMNEWIRYVFSNPVKGLSWVDRLYWEQRAGAWVKNSHQMFDMFDSIRIIPVNCQMLIELLLGFDRDYNTTEKEAQRELIKECCPEIAQVPYGCRYGKMYKVYMSIKNKIMRKVLKKEEW